MWSLLLATLFVALANAAVSYVRTTGACRGGDSPGNNAGLRFYSNRSCLATCNNDIACTGYVLPKSNSNWCETYTSKGATGDKRTSFWCYMKQKVDKVKPQCTGADCIYVRTEGACRGGDSPGNNAGLKFYSNRSCLATCNNDDRCTGYVLPKTNSNWCETYTSPKATGDGRSFWCYMKTGAKKPADSDESSDDGMPKVEGYNTELGACRGGKSPNNNAGLKFYSNRNCESVCNDDDNCTGFVLPKTDSNWCETYTSVGIKGDDRNYWCFIKDNLPQPSCREGDKVTCTCYKWYQNMCAAVDLSGADENKDKKKACKKQSCKYTGGASCSVAIKNNQSKLKKCKKAKKGVYVNRNGVTKPICECFQGCKYSEKGKKKKPVCKGADGEEHTGFADTDL